MIRHTKGPWIATSYSMSDEIPCAFTVTLRARENVSGILELQENAKVASAATELLEALNELVVAADTFSVSGVYFNSFKENFAALKKAMQAIEKAEGEA